MIRQNQDIPDAGLQAIAERLAQVGILAAQKAASHLVDAAAYPLPAGPSLEAAFLSHIQTLPVAQMQKLVANTHRLNALPTAIDLHSATPVATSVPPATHPAINLAALAASRRLTPAPNAAPPGVFRQQDTSNIVSLDVTDVYCDHVTGLIGLEGDHIVVSGVAIDDSGKVFQLAQVDLGSFHSGDPDNAMPSPYASFSIATASNWPKTYAVLIILTELHSGGGLQQYMSQIVDDAIQAVQDAVVAGGAAIGAVIGGVAGALIGFGLGEIFSYVAGWVLNAVWNWLQQQLFGDDIFSPETLKIELPFPGASGTPVFTFDDSQYGGEYTVSFQWLTQWGAPNVNACMQTSSVNGKWMGSWGNFGGVFNYDIAIASMGAGDLHLIGPGTDDTLFHNFSSNGSWSGWSPIGAPTGGVTSGPAAVAQGNARIDLVVRGTDNAIWHAAFGQNTWSSWDSLGGVSTSAPGICSWGAGRLDVFTAGQDGTIYHKWYDNGWSDWVSVGAPLNQPVTSGPAAVALAPNVLKVVVRGADMNIWFLTWSGSWLGWEMLPGLSNASYGPAVAAFGPDSLWIFAVDEHNHLWANGTQKGLIEQWLPLDGTFTSRPAAVAQGPAEMNVVGRGP